MHSKKITGTRRGSGRRNGERGEGGFGRGKSDGVEKRAVRSAGECSRRFRNVKEKKRSRIRRGGRRKRREGEGRGFPEKQKDGEITGRKSGGRSVTDDGVFKQMDR